MRGVPAKLLRSLRPRLKSRADGSWCRRVTDPHHFFRFLLPPAPNETTRDLVTGTIKAVRQSHCRNREPAHTRRQFLGRGRTIIGSQHRGMKPGTRFSPLMFACAVRTDSINHLNAHQIRVHQEIVDIEHDFCAGAAGGLHHIFDWFTPGSTPDDEYIGSGYFIGMLGHLIQPYP